jgi:nucleoside-diphosphate-sugar epimerase
VELAITGVPGWFTAAFLDSLRTSPLESNLHVRALVMRSLPIDERLRASYPNVATWLPYELLQPDGFEQLLEGCDTVVHAAGVIHPRKPAEWRAVNTIGTLALAAAAKRVGVRRFIFISSNAAGGASDSAADVLTEDAPAKPRSEYGLSKLEGERALLNLHEPGRFEVVNLRPSMFYGSPVPERHVDIYRRILSGSMPLVGHGNYRRSITHIDNLVQAARLALRSHEASGQTYYIVDRDVYTTLSIMEAMAEALEVKPRFVRVPAAAGPLAHVADNVLTSLGMYSIPIHLVGESHWHIAISPKKAMRELGYAPTGSLREGMREAVRWCREQGLL